MSLSEIISWISFTITPVVLISAIGLIELMMQNRYGRVKDRVFAFIKYKRELEEVKAPEYAIQAATTILDRYSREIGLIKNAMIFGFIAISGVAVTVVLLLIGPLLLDTFIIEIVILWIYGGSVMALVMLSLVMVVGLGHSQKSVDHEIDTALPSVINFCGPDKSE